eukprot:7651785-Lingulodinium_polyedra.AAC.1
MERGNPPARISHTCQPASSVAVLVEKPFLWYTTKVSIQMAFVFGLFPRVAVWADAVDDVTAWAPAAEVGQE